jgi:hypothetical protein
MTTPIHPAVPAMPHAQRSTETAAIGIPDRTDDHVTVETGLYRVWASCTCGYRGAQRQTRAAAEFDAGQHTAETGHR